MMLAGMLLGDAGTAAAEEIAPQTTQATETANNSRAWLQARRLSTHPLEPMGPTDAAENRDLNAALGRFATRTSRDDVSAITGFLESHPRSAWRASVFTDLGEEYFRTGHFSKALAAWEAVWQKHRPLGQRATLPLPVQRAAAELANLYARLGRMESLRQLLQELEGTRMMGEFAAKVQGAREGLWTMDHRPEIAFRCGPLALDRIRAWGNPTNGCNPLIFTSRSTTNGICLEDVARLARDLGMNYQIAFRRPGAKVIVPSVIHWKVGHYAAVVRETNGLFLTQDPTFWSDTWASQPTLDDEASGYFLVPAGPLPKGWRPVSTQEAAAVWGKGTTMAADPDATSDRDEGLNQCPNSSGMAVWDFNLMLVNQRIMDTPIGYQPPVGPPVYFKFTMNAQDNWMRQFASWWGTTLGENWSCNWNSFIQDDPLNPDGNLRVYDGGGWLTFLEDPSQAGVFRCQFRNPGYITRLILNGKAIGYTWNLPDGGRKVYGSRYDASGASTGHALLTAVVDPAGNAVTLEYDPVFPGRINAIIDAVGQRTTLEYGLTDPGYPVPPPNQVSSGNVQFNWQVTKITDPFGRSATFQYHVIQDGSPPGFYYYVTNITDVVGMNSQLTFYPGWAVDAFPVMPALTTPYGTTRFRPFVLANRNYGIETTDPDGNVERLQYCEDAGVNVPAHELQQNVPHGLTYAENSWLYARNVYYWSKKAYAEGFASNDYSKAVIYHFTHAQNLSASGPILESLKRPLENRVWFNYPGQGAGWFPGSDDHPSQIGRVLDDGTTQLWQFGYNFYGNLTNSIDPVGRTFSFIYDTNGIDLLEVRQTRNGNNELLWKATYNNQHLPLTVTDPAGQTTTCTYNPRGQITTLVNARNETNTFEYDASGYLVAIDGPLPGPQDRDTFSYDAAGRLHMATDQDGYTITLEYDNLDRLTKANFPDGTYQEIVYDRLKPRTFRDRLRRVTTYKYTSLGQLASMQDPLGRLTRFQWCRCGELESLIDPMGRMTSWQRDIQGRVIAKIYADGSTVHYDYEHTTSRLRDTRDEQNQVTQFDYYADDSLKEKSYPNAVFATPSVHFAYDPNYSRMTTMQDGEGTTSYGYYPITSPPALGAGQLATVDGPWANDVITYQYDELGRVFSRAINGVAEARSFDAASRLRQVTNVLGTFSFTWEGGSTRLSTVQYPNGQHSLYTYHPNIRDELLQSITHYLPNNATLSQFGYEYDVFGRITNWVQLQAGVSQTWVPEYDDADRLARVTVQQGGATVQTFNYAYDDADNRTMEQVDGTRRDYYYNALNQIATISNSPVTGVSYGWDAANRLVAITNGTHQTTFGYDGFDRRTHAVEKDGTTVLSDTRFVWQGWSLAEERDASGGSVRKRFVANGEQVVTGANLPPANYFFVGDHLGSVRELADPTGVQAVYSYTPFGSRALVSGTLQGDWGFGGLYVHGASGLLLSDFRAFDPRLARWISRDPVGEAAGPNLYAYVRNSPIAAIDPLGLDGISFSAYDGIGGGLGAAWDASTGNFSVSVELGFGDGISTGYSPDELPPVPQHVYAGITDYSQVSLNGEVGANLGPIGSSAKVSMKSCDDGSFKSPELEGKGSFGPASMSTKGKTGIKVKYKPSDINSLSALGLNKLDAGMSGKANMKLDFIRFDPSPLVAPSPVHQDRASSGPAFIKNPSTGQYVPLNQWQNQ